MTIRSSTIAFWIQYNIFMEKKLSLAIIVTEKHLFSRLANFDKVVK